jgi:membrane protease YdiL (CAAX protease family)
MWVVGLVAMSLWTPLIVVLVSLSTRLGSGNFVRDYSVAFRKVDLLGVPIGIASQLLLVNLVYWPLRELFPATFDVDKVEDRARGLFDRADGAWLVVLVLVVVVGAPVVEELVYRGFIHGSLRGRLSDGLALLGAAVWFTLIHFTPVEFPGLFAFAVVLGLCFHGTGRLGMAIAAHMSFNATGLLLVAGS